MSELPPEVDDLKSESGPEKSHPPTGPQRNQGPRSHDKGPDRENDPILTSVTKIRPSRDRG